MRTIKAKKSVVRKTSQSKNRFISNRKIEAEELLWNQVLKAKKLHGYQFQRHVPFINVVADFMCKKLMLIIEVDGATSHSDKNGIKTKNKIKTLSAFGFKVMRFKDSEILNNIDFVIDDIENHIDNLEQLNSFSSFGNNNGKLMQKTGICYVW